MKGCKHAKPRGPLGILLLWCDPCAEKEAGPKPESQFKHGDYVADRDGDSCKVLDSEIHVIGQATETPSWSEYLIFRDGGGSASLYKKIDR